MQTYARVREGVQSGVGGVLRQERRSLPALLLAVHLYSLLCPVAVCAHGLHSLPDIFVTGWWGNKTRRLRPNIHELGCKKVEKAGHKVFLYCFQLVKELCLWVKFALS